jgi:hypothetical protein
VEKEIWKLFGVLGNANLCCLLDSKEASKVTKGAASQWMINSSYDQRQTFFFVQS